MSYCSTCLVRVKISIPSSQAFRIPNFFRRLFAEGAFSQAFIPVLTEYKTGRAHAEVQILISRVFGCLLTVMTLLTFVAGGFSLKQLSICMRRVSIMTLKSLI